MSLSSSSSSNTPNFMNLQPKIETGSIPPAFISLNPNNNLEDKSIQDIVSKIRGACSFETFDRIEGILVSRDMKLREEIRRLQQKVDLERQKVFFESLSRIQGEVDFRKMEELYEKEKTRLQENNESLLNEVKKLNEKSVDDGNEIEMLRVKNDGLELEVLELRKMKEKWEEDHRSKIGVLRKMVEKLHESSNEKFLGLSERVERLENDAHHSHGVAASGRGTMKLEKKIEIINLDDDDDDDRCMSRGVHEKKSISGIARKVEDATTDSSVAWQHANPVEMVKRKISFSSDSESSSSSSSDDSSFLDNLGKWSAVSHAKKRKM